MDVQSELRIRLLLEYMRIENEAAALDLARGGDWLSDHASVIADYGNEIEDILRG